MLLLEIALIVPALISCKINHVSMTFQTPLRINYIRNSISWVHRCLGSRYQGSSSKSFHCSSQALLARKKLIRGHTVDRKKSDSDDTEFEADDAKAFADAVKSLQRSLSNSSRTLSSNDGAL